MLLRTRLHGSAAAFVSTVIALGVGAVGGAQAPVALACVAFVLAVLAIFLGVFALWKMQFEPVAGYEHRTPQQVLAIADPSTKWRSPVKLLLFEMSGLGDATFLGMLHRLAWDQERTVRWPCVH